MKKILVKVLSLFVILLSGVQFTCQASPAPVQKLKRGLFNIAVCPGEILKYMVKATIDARPDWTGPFHGVFYGIPKGAAYGSVRLISGALDVLTFPVNLPRNGQSLAPIDTFSFDETKEAILKK